MAERLQWIHPGRTPRGQVASQSGDGRQKNRQADKRGGVGGINGENIGSVAADGAQAVGVVSAVFDATEPERAAAELAARFVSGAREI